MTASPPAVPPPTVVLSINDGEAVAVAALARRCGAAVVDLGLGWGAMADPADPRLAPAALGPSVLLVETPGVELEEGLRRAGVRVRVIDHHLYADPRRGPPLDRRSPWSSLEQVAAALGAGPLSRSERVAAAGDRGFWPEMLALLRDEGVGPADAVAAARAARIDDLAVRLGGAGAAERALGRALSWLDEAEGRGLCARFAPHRGDGGGDGELFLLRAPADLSSVLMDALYLRRLRDDPAAVWSLCRPMEALALFEGAEGEPVFLFASLAGTRAALVEEAATQWGTGAGEGDDDAPLARLVRWSGGGGRTAFFGAVPGPAGEGGGLDRLAARLLEALLGGNRPLRRWATHFLAMVELPADAPPLEAPPAPPSAAERLYPLPHRRDLLTPADGVGAHPLALRSHAVPCDGLALRIGAVPGGPAVAGALLPLTGLAVHRLGDRLAVVDWSVGGAVEAAEAVDGAGLPRWRALLDLGRAVADLPPERVATVAQLLDANEAARWLYSPFAMPGGRHRVTLERDGRTLGHLDVGAGVADDGAVPDGWFAALLAVALAPLVPGRVRLLHDERARVVCAMTAAGSPPHGPAAHAAERVMLARLSGVDPHGTAHAYTPAVAEAELDRGLYDRFAAFGTRYAVTGHSLVMSGYGWFPAHVIGVHVTTHYRRLFLVALLRDAMAARLSALASAAAAGDGTAGDGAAGQGLREAAAFRATLGAGPVTGQLQGQELFALMLRQTDADARLDAAVAVLRDMAAG